MKKSITHLLFVSLFSMTSPSWGGINCWPGQEPCNPWYQPTSIRYCNKEAGFLKGWWISEDGSASTFGYPEDQKFLYSISQMSGSSFYLNQYTSQGQFQKLIGPFQQVSSSEIKYDDEIFSVEACVVD